MSGAQTFLEDYSAAGADAATRTHMHVRVLLVVRAQSDAHLSAMPRLFYEPANPFSI